MFNHNKRFNPFRVQFDLSFLTPSLIMILSLLLLLLLICVSTGGVDPVLWLMLAAPSPVVKRCNWESFILAAGNFVVPLTIFCVSLSILLELVV